MHSNNIRAIIFDLGNVLIDFDHQIAARRISRFTDKNPEEIFRLFFDSGLTRLFEEGKIKPLDFFSAVKKTLNAEIDYTQFLPIWNEIFFLTAENRKVYDLAKILRNHYKLVLLSNINILHFDYLKHNFPVFDVFHNILTSFELRFTKPNPLVYAKALRVLRVLPEETIYTDDRAELVEKAAALGIRGFVFKSAEQLKKDFITCSIQIS